MARAPHYRRRFERCLIASVVLFSALSGAAQAGDREGEGPASSSERLRVLFLGHSFLFQHNVPALVQGLARSAGHDLEVEMVWSTGESLFGHWIHGKAREAIEKGGWDYVVLLDRSTFGRHIVDGKRRVDPTGGKFGEYAPLLGDEIRAVGARTILFLPWAPQYAPQDQDILNWHVYTVAARMGALVARVGPAWMEALERDDLPPLYKKDGSHPAPAGSYLAACVLFADLFQESPMGLTSRIEGQVYRRDGTPDRRKRRAVLVDLDPGVATVLQELAWEEARRYRELPSR